MSIPSHVWVYDSNRRIYRDLTAEERAAGRIWSSGPPIWREHWRKRKVEGETRQSWILEHGSKVRKDSLDVVTSEAALDDRCLVNDHAHKIGDAVARLTNAETLRAIAALVGYQP